MNDFLQKLRNNQAERQRTPMTRKHYDDAYYHNMQQYQYVNQAIPAHHRSPVVPAEETDESQIQMAIARLSDGIRRLTDQQMLMVQAQERTADMLERQVIGVERILRCIKISS